MSRLLLSLCVLLALACLSVLVAANCSTGETEVTTPGLLDGIVPETGELMQQPALTLTLWPISLSLLPQVNGNVTDFVGAFGQCQAATGCATGKIQLGLYHFHLVGTFNPNEAGKVHLIYYSDIITYHPHFQGRAPNTVIEYKKAAAHPQVPSEPLIPFPEGNPFTGYFIGILSTVPYGIYFGAPPCCLLS